MGGPKHSLTKARNEEDQSNYYSRRHPHRFTQRNQAHRDLLSREAAHREELYSQFIKEAANLYIDSLDKTLENRPR
jgi:hypothetical protein